MSNEICEALEKRRVQLGLSIRDLASAAGISYPYVHQILCARDDPDKRHSPTLGKLEKIMKPLGLRLKLVRDRS